ncbi:MAG: hypothetical protein CMJ81_14560 [Planctomycetaceae bacterium]|nr:hypothetical protein [Planctomycetaceae bacterium]MBP60900.1 hypothetical protein [Planctomycetaceae bacterium]
MALMAPGWMSSAFAEPALPMELIAKPTVMTDQMGGVPHPSKNDLVRMHQSGYILRARNGKLSRLNVEKTLLPHDFPMTPQGVQVDLGADNTLFVRLTNKLCKSKDGGRTWTSHLINAPGGYAISQTGRWKVMSDGTLICVSVISGEDERAAARVWESKDEARSWKPRSKIPLNLNVPQTGHPYDARYCHRGLERLQDDTLLWFIELREFSRERTEQEQKVLKHHALFYFRSKDGGKSWQGPSLMGDWLNEGAATLLPSGRILATVRYQRDRISQDSPDLVKHMGAYFKTPDRPGFKNVFLMNSNDGGSSWTPPRMLTTVYGQTFGYPAALGDGTVVVVHDTRYGPGPPGSRALISRDQGQTWEDEVYYLDSTNFPGSYTASVVLADDTILTIAGSCTDPSISGFDWENVQDKTDLYSIRWKPVTELHGPT